MNDFIRIAFGRSLFVGTAFAVTAVLMVILGLTPERSVFDWVCVALVLSMLSLLSAFTVTFCERKAFSRTVNPGPSALSS